MASSHRQNLAASSTEMLDTALLFEKYTIDEIRLREKKTRAEIEKKKEDLRVMVGERYRDLIEAADTITAMKNSSENVTKSISRMEELCHTLQKQHMVKGSTFQHTVKPDNIKKRQETEFFGVAAQIKVLLDMPEKIWSNVDSGNYLVAAQLYLLARHINTSLHLDGQRSAKVLSWFPVLTRQWAAISHFKTTILQGCRAVLADTENYFSDQKMADILSTILLLDDSNPRQVFNEFLLARTKALQQILYVGQQSNIKEQISGVVRLLTSTVQQIHAVFYDPGSNVIPDSQDSCNLLLNTLNTVVHANTLNKVFGIQDMQDSISAKCLPKSVKEFHPVLRSAVAAITTDKLQGNCQQWISTCMQDIRTGVGKLLNYINSVKRLADIRDAVWDILEQNEHQAKWGTMCQHVVNKSLLVWQDFLQPLFLNRVKALIQYQLDTTAEMSKRSVSKVMMELTSDIRDSAMIFEVDVGQFLWSESSGDVQMNSVWMPAAARTLSQSGGLIFKARAFTPAVQSLCQNIDGKLKSLLQDNQSYLQPLEETEPQNKDASGPFNKFADSGDILQYCQTACTKCVQDIVDYMSQQLSLWESSLKEIPDPATQAITENKILLVARTCSALCELTPHLQKCILGVSEWQRQESAGNNRRIRAVQKPADAPEWQTVTHKLDQCRMMAFRIWVQHTVSHIISDFTIVAVNGQLHNIVEKMTRWEEIEIMEETEEGKKLSSKIYVPMQASWFVQSTLFKLCQTLNRVGSHAFPRSVVRDVLIKILQGMLGAYERLLKEGQKGSKAEISLSQQEALQNIFDMKYILSIIPWKDDTESSKACQNKGQAIVDKLEEHIDPFDLDVFLPYLQSNLMKAVQRNGVLLGILSSLDRHAIVGGGRSSMGGQEQHNVLPLTNCANRFPLLPVGSQSGRPSLAQQTVLSQTINRSLDAVGMSSLTAVVESTLPKSSSQSELGSSFYDKLDLLGSMGSRLFSNIGGKS